MTGKELINSEGIQGKIHTIRGVQVMLDSDLYYLAFHEGAPRVFRNGDTDLESMVDSKNKCMFRIVPNYFIRNYSVKA